MQKKNKINNMLSKQQVTNTITISIDNKQQTKTSPTDGNW